MRVTELFWLILDQKMRPALYVLVAVHPALGCLPFFISWIPPHVRYMPIIWLIGAITVAQTMLLGFWMGMGTNPWRRRLLGTLLGSAYISSPAMIQGPALPSLIYGAIVVLLSGVFLVMRRWLVLQQVQVNRMNTPSPRLLQFSILHLLVLTSLVAVVFALVRSARLASTDSVWFTTVMWMLMLSTLVINALCSTTATLAIHNYPVKLTANFLVSFLLGVAISLTMNRNTTGAPPLPWWIWFGGIYITMCLTLVIVASLLIVRSCGYRLIPRSLPVGR